MGGGGGGAGLAGLLERGDYFKFFRQRETIIGGRRLIEGRLLFEELQYLFIYLFIHLFLLLISFRYIWWSSPRSEVCQWSWLL